MVFTKLLLDDSTPELRKFPFGVLAAQPEEVGEDLVPKILATTGMGTAVEFLTTDKGTRARHANRALARYACARHALTLVSPRVPCQC